jgi:hypothetical protein
MSPMKFWSTRPMVTTALLLTLLQPTCTVPTIVPPWHWPAPANILYEVVAGALDVNLLTQPLQVVAVTVAVAVACSAVGRASVQGVH